MLLCYYVIRGITLLQYPQQSLFYIYTDYQYITTFIKQRMQLYYNNLHYYYMIQIDM